jgi:hypothetical protein
MNNRGMYLTSYLIRIALFFVVALCIIVGLLIFIKKVKTGQW